jgi:hypothetical protein
MTGFPRGSDSDSDGSDSGPHGSREKPSDKVKARGVRAQKAACFKTPGTRALPTTVRQHKDTTDGKDGYVVALPSGLKDVRSVVIVFDPVFGPRLRRILDAAPCEPADHLKVRRPELLQVSISKSRSTNTVREHYHVHTVCVPLVGCYPHTVHMTRSKNAECHRGAGEQEVCTTYVDSTCEKCRQCFFAQDRTRAQTVELAELLGSLNL